MSVSYDPVEDGGEEFEPETDGELEDGLGAIDEIDPDSDDAVDPVTGRTRGEARTAGWKPLEEFKGEPRLWRDWPEFLQHGYEDPRVLRENHSRLLQKTARQERQLNEARVEVGQLRGQVDELLSIAKRADKSAYDQRREALEQKRRDAVAEGDTSAFDRVEAELRRVETEQAAPLAPETPAKPSFHPAITEFVEANPWWSKSPELQKSMNSHYDIIMRTRKDLDIEDQLQLAKQRLMADYPGEDFGEPAMPITPRRLPAADPRRPAAAGVARPTGSGAVVRRPSRQVSGWDTIPDPKERQQAVEAFQNARRSDPGLTEDEYLTIYHDPKGADPLELRRKRIKV